MPLAFLAIGTLFLIAAVRGTLNDKDGQPGLLSLLKNDFTGQGNFIYWLTAIFVLGTIGYINGFKPIANAFLVLFILVLILANSKGSVGLFSSFTSALNKTTTSNKSSTFTF